MSTHLDNQPDESPVWCAFAWVLIVAAFFAIAFLSGCGTTPKRAEIKLHISADAIRSDVAKLREHAAALKSSLTQYLTADQQQAVKPHVDGIETVAESIEGHAADVDSTAEAVGKIKTGPDLGQRATWLGILILAGAGVSFVLVRNPTISLAIAAFGGVLFGVGILFDKLSALIVWIGGGLIVLGIVWIVAESIIRGSLKRALSTTPAQDWADVLRWFGKRKPVVDLTGKK